MGSGLKPDVGNTGEFGKCPGKDATRRRSRRLGGKNVCVIYPDADLTKTTSGAVNGMNFT